VSEEKQTLDAEVVEEKDSAFIESSALTAITNAELDRQITTAKAYPRSLAEFRKEAEQMATLDEETAGRMFYRLTRGGKTIEGPSIRLAEVAVAAWGHTFWGSRPIAVEEKVVRCQGMAWDMQKNNRRLFEVSRRITDKDGRRYSDDMITITQNACSQIAARNAVFGVIPRVYVDALVAKCKKVYLGDVKAIGEKRKSCIAEFEKLGAKKEDVLRLVGRKGIDDITIDDLITLKGILTAVQDGDTTLAESFAAASPDGGVTKVTVEGLEDFTPTSAQDDKPSQEAAPKPQEAPKPAPAPPKPQASHRNGAKAKEKPVEAAPAPPPAPEPEPEGKEVDLDLLFQ